MNETNNEQKTAENEAPHAEAKFCPRCGKPLPQNALFCGECGANISGTANNTYTPPAPQKVEDTAPLTTGDYFIMLLLFSLPIIGFIMMCVWAFGGNTNVNRRNFCRANLIWFAIAAVLSVFLWGMILAVVGFTAGVMETSSAYSFFSMILTRF